MMMRLLRVDGAPLDVQVMNSFAESIHINAIVLKLRGPCDCNERISAMSAARAIGYHFNIVNQVGRREIVNGFTNFLASHLNCDLY